MKIILWRMAHDCLPTGTQLKCRHVSNSNACYFCGREETVEHAIFMCPYANEVWRQIRKSFLLNWKPQVFVNIKQCLFDFLDEANDAEAIAFTITVWHIWEARNAARNGENMMHPHSIAERTKAYIEMVLMHSTKQPTPHRCESNCLVPKWTPSPDGWLMFNVDATTFKEPSRIGVGVVIRNHVGDFKMAFCKKIHRVEDPDLAEALAVRCAVVFAKEHNLRNIIVALDCQNIIKKLQSPKLDRSQVGTIVCDVKNLVTETPFSFMYTRRSCNEAAHVLARLADQFCDKVWCDEAPDVIRAILCNDRLS
jgi:hypothetical protein